MAEIQKSDVKVKSIFFYSLPTEITDSLHEDNKLNQQSVGILPIAYTQLGDFARATQRS